MLDRSRWPFRAPFVSEKPLYLTNAYDIWLASRESEPGHPQLQSGAQRPLTRKNIYLAKLLLQGCIFDILKDFWTAQPIRTTMLVILHLTRSLFPAFRGYSQALIIDEIQSMVSSGVFTWSRLLRLIATEVVRRIFEGSLNAVAASTESTVLGSAKFLVERHQLQLRVRLDGASLADPVVRDLLQESDLFSRSFHGSGFGLISPLDFIQIFAHLAEIISHLFLMFSLTKNGAHYSILLLSIISVSLPSFLTSSRMYPDATYSHQDIQAVQDMERMRGLAYSDMYRSEVALFGLGDWILQTWSHAWKTVFESDQRRPMERPGLLGEINVADFVFAFQNIPLVLLLQTSSASLGSLTLYRSSIQSVILSFRSLMATSRMAFQSIFLMAAFCASVHLRPKLEPSPEERVDYQSINGGASLELRGLFYTYPGCTEPALSNINLTLAEGETLAIVGYNGSGKTTLANILLRIMDFDSGHLLVNGIDIRRYRPSEYHKHISAVFQNFSKFNTTCQENVGLGYVNRMSSTPAVQAAVKLAEAEEIVKALPLGLQTTLQCPGFDPIPHYGNSQSPKAHHGLSGGEWQRIAIARAFMRAKEPEIDLLIFDEPTSSLDAHAQSQIFDTIHQISHPPDSSRRKTTIFITHRLSTARRADKVAMMENGTIVEFGTHSELLKQCGAYATLYHQSV